MHLCLIFVHNSYIIALNSFFTFLFRNFTISTIFFYFVFKVHFFAVLSDSQQIISLINIYCQTFFMIFFTIFSQPTVFAVFGVCLTIISSMMLLDKYQNEFFKKIFLKLSI